MSNVYTSSESRVLFVRLIVIKYWM